MLPARHELSPSTPESDPTVTHRFAAADGSVKYLWRLSGGLEIESISLIVPQRTARWSLDPADPPTVWPAMRIAGISSQAGCNVRCRFCSTGLQPNRRNLTAQEMIAQAEVVMADFPQDGPVGVTFAGMGEPLLNLDAVVCAGRTLLKHHRVDHVTISTSGVVPAMQRLAEQTADLGLWISLHAANDEVRSSLIPHNRKYPIASVLQAARDYAKATNARVGISYLLLAGLNDSRADAIALSELLHGGPFNVQLLLWNKIDGMPFGRVSDDHALAFMAELTSRGLDAYLMPSAAQEIDGGCGQLVTSPSARRVEQAAIVPKVLGSA